MLDRFYLWLINDIMPPRDPFLAASVRIMECARKLRECTESLGPAMAQAAIAFRQFAETVEDLAWIAELNDAQDD